jgi:hypothetical protein
MPAAFNASSFLAAMGGKGKTVQGIVEGVVNGGMLRVTMLPSLQQTTVVGGWDRVADRC